MKTLILLILVLFISNQAHSFDKSFDINREETIPNRPPINDDGPGGPGGGSK